MKIIIIGGVAAGASAAARLRRLDESCEIVLLEKGGFISYANCGLPYHLGGVIAERDDLLVMSPEKFSEWLNVKVRIHSEVTAIDRAKNEVVIRSANGETREHYDKLLIATGATPITGGHDKSKRILPLWTLADMDRIMAQIPHARKAILVGAGFIGLEAAENLRERGLEVTVIQRGDHVLPTMDSEMTGDLEDELADSGIELKLNTMVSEYEEDEKQVTAILSDGSRITADFVLEAIGVKPNSKIAVEAGLECGPKGHIIVNDTLQTSDPDIFAAGDVIEVRDPIFGGKTAIPLAGPANKQGRIAAANLLGKQISYPGSYGVSVVKIGHLTAASAGYTESRLTAMGKDFRKIYLHPSSHASYYPQSARLKIKLIFGLDGAICGAQITGAKGVDKRIDTISQAMQHKLTAPELGSLELAYAPPYSSAKDPVNFAGFIAENVLSGLSDVVYPDTIPADAVVLDVREPDEHELGAIPGAINIRLGDLRSRLGELDKNKLIVCCCQVGLRGYLAERILKQNGFRAANLSGGWMTWKMYHHTPKAAANPHAPQQERQNSKAHEDNVPIIKLDVRGLPCPGPVIKLKQNMASMTGEGILHLTAARSFESDLQNWAKGAGCQVTNLRFHDDDLEADVSKQNPSATETDALPKSPCCSIPANGENKDGVSIILFSNDLDKALAAMILANGFAAAGSKVTIFFTFWGLSVLRKNPGPQVSKTLIEKMFGWMLPKGAGKLALSKMNMMGMGTEMMKNVMKQQNVLSLPELIDSARAAGVRFIACDMAMGVMGIKREELIDIDEVAGVATFAQVARSSANTLFI